MPYARTYQLERHTRLTDNLSHRRCRQDPHATRYRQVPRSNSPHRRTQFRVERLADLVVCSLSEASGQSLLKKGTSTFNPFMSFVVPHVGLQVWTAVPRSGLARLLLVVGSIQLTCWMTGLVPPLLLEAPKRATKLCVPVLICGCNLGLTSLERCERFLGQDLSRALGRGEDEPNTLHRDGLRCGVRIIYRRRRPLVSLNFLPFPEPPSPSSSFRSSSSRLSTPISINLLAKPFVLTTVAGFRLQDKSSTFAGPMDVLKTIVRKEGVLGLYAGMESTFWRHLWWNGGYFGAIFQVKALLPKPTVRVSQPF